MENSLDSAQNNSRLWILASHISPVLGLVVPTANVFAPLAIWIFKGKNNPELEKHSRESANFQITMTVALAITLATSFVMISLTVGFGSLLAWPLFSLVGFLNIAYIAVLFFDGASIVLAAVRYNESRVFKYRLSYEFIKGNS